MITKLKQLWSDWKTKRLIGRAFKSKQEHKKAVPINRPGAAIVDAIGKAPNISVLADLRDELNAGLDSGRLTPQTKTRRAWNDAVWNRALQLLIHAKTRAEADAIVETAEKWPGWDQAGRVFGITHNMVSKLVK